LSHKPLKKIVLIGSGNVATHLAKQFAEKGFVIRQVYSRTIENARFLALRYNALAINALHEVETDADMYVFSVSDNALFQLVEELKINTGIVLHTSGAIGIDVLKKFKNYGVFYPLQTFSKNIEINFKEVPLLIEANTSENLRIIENLALKFTPYVHNITSEQRHKVHLAAVFACNFTNYMYRISEKILNENNLSFDILKPLILQTAKKIETHLPSHVQTGPAHRNDNTVIEKHLSMLNEQADRALIYKILSEQIKRNNIKNE